MAFKDAFNDLNEAYNEDMRYLYNKDGVKYKKSDPERNKHTKMVESWWMLNDEENGSTGETNYYSGF